MSKLHIQGRTPWVDLVLLSVPVIWGLNFSIMKNLYTYFDPLAFTSLRFVTAVATLAAVLKLRDESLVIERGDLPVIMGLGILSTTIYQIFFVLGLAHTKAGNAGLLMAPSPIFAYLASVVLKWEPFNNKVFGGILLSTAGVAIVVLFGSKQVALGESWRGDGMILVSAICWGWYTGSAARLISKYGVTRLTLWAMTTGTAFLLPVVAPSVIRQDWRAIPFAAWLGFCYSTFLSIVYCYLAWSFALKYAGVSRTVLYSNLTPLIAVLGGWALLGERPVIWQMIGAALILAGVFIVRAQKPIVGGQ